MRYTVRCDECGRTEVVELAMRERNMVGQCGHCGGAVRRDVMADIRTAELRIPRHMQAAYDDEYASVRKAATSGTHSTLGNPFTPRKSSR